MKDKDAILLESAYELVLEQPYISINNEVFDLELEYYKNNPYGVIDKLNKLFSLQPVTMWERKTDREPITFRFNNINDAKKYWEELKRNNMFKMFLNHWDKNAQISSKDFLNLLKFK